MNQLAHKPREDFELTEIERIAEGVIATAENFRDGKISAHAAHRSSLHFLDLLNAVDEHENIKNPLQRRAKLLAHLTYEWALEVESGGEFSDVRQLLNLASRMVLIVQTTMAREAGRMP